MFSGVSIIDTKILSSNDDCIQLAADCINKGEIVAIPTETVYGLAADALNENAVKKIFKAKGRPYDNPLIVHIAEIADMDKYAQKIPNTAYMLAKKFCPGPLTMVLLKRAFVPDITSGGLDTVALRIPSDQTALALIKASRKPLAAPSANISGSPSPTKAEHVMRDLGGKISAVIDGGACRVGIESTVISFESDGVRILRPGAVTAEAIERLGVRVYHDKSITTEIKSGEKALSPGMKYRHYSPKAEVTIVEGNFESFVKYMSSNISEGVYAVIFDSDAESYPFENYFTYGDTSEETAARLYEALRGLDDAGAKRGFVRAPSKTGIGLAVYNRLLRAAEFRVVNS
ncbi:MAG: L-threonylcarbamoyladenylate synthase [Oscillospiraceae bacterium]|nr:L-threonylcarbamoyladenylate synthase [Oscillospiraceae bacterium]